MARNDGWHRCGLPKEIIDVLKGSGFAHRDECSDSDIQHAYRKRQDYHCRLHSCVLGCPYGPCLATRPRQLTFPGA